MGTYRIRSSRASSVLRVSSFAPEPRFFLMSGFPGWIDNTQMIPVIAASMVVVM